MQIIKILILLALLVSKGVSAEEVVVKVDMVKGVVRGIPKDQKIEYSGTTSDGYCFVVTRPNIPFDDWDSRSYTGLYDGKCGSALQAWGPQNPRKSRDGRVIFEYNIHPTPNGPYNEDFDVILISVLAKVPSTYKKKPTTLTNWRIE